MQGLFKEPITRYMVLLVLAFLFAFSSFLLSDKYMSDKSREIDARIENEFSRRRLGRVILRELQRARGDIYRIAMIRDPRDIERASEEVEAVLDKISQILTILQRGGKFSDLLPANFDMTDEIVETYSYVPASGEAFIMPAIELRPNIQEIKNLTERLADIVKKNNFAPGAPETPDFTDKVENCLKMLETYLHSSQECAVRLFHEANISIIALENERRKSEESYSRTRLTVLVALSFSVLALISVILRNVRSIVKDRKSYIDRISLEHDNMQKVFDALPAGLVLVDKNRIVRELNLSALELTGFSKEDCVGKKCNCSFCPSLDGKCPVFDLGETLRHSEKKISTKDGRIIPVIKNAVSININGEELLLEVFIDISKRKRAEEKLRKLSHVVEQSPLSIVITDTDGAIEYVNPRFSELTGYGSEEAVGLNPRILKGSDTPSEVYEEMWKAIRSGNEWHGFLHNKKKNGEYFWEDATISPLLDENGKVTHYIGIKQDVTMQMKQQEQLKEAKEAAVAASLAKSEFLANMSHEIRTPMNGVIGMTGLLMGTSLDAEQRHYVEIMRSSAESLLRLINDILDFSKIEAGKLQIENIEFKIYDVLDDFAALMALRTHEKGIDFDFIAESDISEVLRGDPDRLLQILNNLMGNAIKFTERGKITLRVSLAPSSALTRLSENEITIRFSVCDTGIGIPKEKLGILFEKFTQIDASTTRRFGGTGLGLAISKELSSLMGGEIGVESSEGRGSEFWFTVRFQRVLEAAGSSTIGSPLKGLRALIIQGGSANAEALRSILSSWGIETETEDSPDEALKSLALASKGGRAFSFVAIGTKIAGEDGIKLGRTISVSKEIGSPKLLLIKDIGEAGIQSDPCFFASLPMPVKRKELREILLKAFGETSTSGGGNALRSPDRPSLFRPSRDLRVLLAEDNVVNQKVALGMLKKLGLTADAVPNGLEAIAALERIRYDLVFMDCQMPIMDGYEATRKIRATDSKVLNRRTPIIAMTANAMQGDREKCLEAGMDDYISKPVSTTAMSDCLAKWIS